MVQKMGFQGRSWLHQFSNLVDALVNSVMLNNAQLNPVAVFRILQYLGKFLDSRFEVIRHDYHQRESVISIASE